MSTSEPDFLKHRDGWQPQGCIIVEKFSTVGTWAGKVVQVHLNFFSAKELADAVAWAVANGYQPAMPSQNVIRATDLFAPGPETIPQCPDHHCPMEPSKKFDGFFCKRKNGSEWCKRKATRNAAGALVVK
jgi:hypothetical protein